MTDETDTTRLRRNLYGRRRSHALRPGMKALMEEFLPTLAVPGVDPAENPARDPVDLALLFPGAKEIWLEVGFGGGEHLIAEAKANPDVGLIGCEHYIDGVAKCLASVEREGLSNIRVHPHDARDLLDVTQEGALGRVYLLYPDPWPKTRHHKRRFMGAENLDLLARAMRPGAELRVATDIPDYARHALEAVHLHPAFEWTAERAADWREPWAGWPGTRYEAKALREGRAPHYLIFRRL